MSYFRNSETAALVSLPGKIKWTASSILEIEKSRGLKEATNVGKARYGGPPNKEGDFQANRTLQNGLIHTLLLHVTHDQSF